MTTTRTVRTEDGVDLPDAELVVVPGAGHSVVITRPEVVDGALLRLLDRVQQQRAA